MQIAPIVSLQEANRSSIQSQLRDRFVRTITALTVLSSFCLSGGANAQVAAPAVGQLTDFIDVADTHSEKAHGFQSHGTVTRELSGDFVGGHDMRRMARVVQDAGSLISYQIKVQPGAPVTLEFEEIDNRLIDIKSDDVRGYSVWVDGQRAYFRTARRTGAGPLHYFVQVPPRSNGVLNLKLQNETETPFRIARVWAFSNFMEYFRRSDMAVPYYLAPTFRPSFNDFEADRQKLQAIKTSLGDHPNVHGAWTTWIAYTNLNDRELAARIEYVLRLSRVLDLPVQISFDTWWGSTPNGVDGQGGFWGDVPYQQVVYNQAKKQYELSIPNRWGNTPWLTMGHPDLNAFKVARLQTAMRILQEQHSKLREQGRGDLVLAINLDNEPVYWATGNAGLGNDILHADFNPVMVEAARRDNVELNPVDGLSFDERLWLRRQLLNYHGLIGRTAAEAVRESVLLNSPSTRRSGDYLRNNIYTQAWVANPSLQFPMQSEAYPLWETGAPVGVRVGGEWNGNSIREREAVLHQLPLGRTAQVNAESGSRVDEMIGVRPGYALGQRYYAMYNYPLDKMDVAASQLHDLSQAFPAPVYERLLREEMFDENWQSRVIATEGLQRGLIGNTNAVAVFPTAEANKGWMTYRLDAPGESFEGLTLEFSGRAFVSRDRNPNVFIRVLAGPENDVVSMQELGRISDDSDINAVHRFDLSAVAQGQKTVYARIELNADRLPPSVLSWASIYHLRFTQPWRKTLLETAFTQDETIVTQRQQNLLVSWRRDAELAIAALENTLRQAQQQNNDTVVRSAKAVLSASQQNYGRGEYADAYHQANNAINRLAPGASYCVTEDGRLSPYPITIRTTAPVTVGIDQWSKDAVSFSLRSQKTATAQLRIEDLRPKQTYSLVPQGQPGRWELRRARAGDGGLIRRLTADAAGTVEWTMPVISAELVRETVVRGIGRGPADLATGEVILWRVDGQGLERIRLSSETRVLRGEPGELKPSSSSELQRGDEITVHLGANGAVERLTAETQTLEGVVQEVGQLTPYSMPFVQLRGSATRHIIDLAAPLSLPNSNRMLTTVTFRGVPLGSVNLQPGDQVKLRLHPRTGRVFELWKTQRPAQ